MLEASNVGLLISTEHAYTTKSGKLFVPDMNNYIRHSKIILVRL